VTSERPPVHLTARVLTAGSLASAALLGLSLVLYLAGQANARLVGDFGILVLLGTPVAGLGSTWWELRRSRPTHAWLAVAVLLVLLLATVVALTARV
jgi:hypothetical protein